MNELIVITYKLPTDEWTRKLYGDNTEYIYDSVAFHSDQLAELEIKKLRRKYTEVDSFVCDFAAYSDWVDNDVAYEEFVRTGVCPLKPVEEDVDVGTDHHSEHIHLILAMERKSPDAEFDYNVDIDESGQIVFTPKSSSVWFVDIHRAAGYDGTAETIENDIKTFSIDLTADMISDSDNFDWLTDIDEIGQAVVTPDSEDTSFLSVSVENSLNLVTEGAEEIALNSDCDTVFNIGDRVIVHLNGNDRPGVIVDYVDTDPMDDATGADSSEFGAWVVRFDDSTQEMIGTCYMTHENEIVECEKTDSMKVLKESNKYRDFDWNDDLYAVIKNDGTYAGVPCRSYAEASQLAYHPGSKIFKLVLEDDATEEPLEENLSELDRMDVVNKVMRGDISVFSGEGEPEESYIRIPELDNKHGMLKFEYYYDPDSNSVVSYSKSRMD